MLKKGQLYLPTKEELFELGFKEESIVGAPYYTIIFNDGGYGERCNLDVTIKNEQAEYCLGFCYDQGCYVYPESKDDLKTLIRLLTPPTNADSR